MTVQDKPGGEKNQIYRIKGFGMVRIVAVIVIVVVAGSRNGSIFAQRFFVVLYWMGLFNIIKLYIPTNEARRELVIDYGKQKFREL